MGRVSKPKYVALVTTPGSVVRVFGPWTSHERALDFQRRVNDRIEAIEERRGMSAAHESMRYGRVTLRAISPATIREAVMTATDGIPS